MLSDTLFIVNGYGRVNLKSGSLSLVIAWIMDESIPVFLDNPCLFYMEIFQLSPVIMT